MLSPLQEQVAEIIAGLDEATDFALAGGAVLISRGDVQRQTKDLDFFGLTTDTVDRLLPAVERALQSAGLTVLTRWTTASSTSNIGRRPHRTGELRCDSLICR